MYDDGENCAYPVCTDSVRSGGTGDARGNSAVCHKMAVTFQFYKCTIYMSKECLQNLVSEYPTYCNWKNAKFENIKNVYWNACKGIELSINLFQVLMSCLRLAFPFIVIQ